MPNGRVGNRQRTCSRPECQRERHRRACEDWHRRNPNYDREDRLRRGLIGESAEGVGGNSGGPLRRVDEEVARDAVGMEVYVFIDEIVRLLLGWARDVVVMKPHADKGELGKVVASGSRDAMAKSRPPP